MKLILNGGGSDEQIKDSVKLFANMVKDGKVMYIPLAWDNGNIEKCIDWFRKQVEPYGIKRIVQVLDANEITTELLKECKGVFIGGGNTYKLLKMLKETQVYYNLKEFIKRNDTVVMGGSAGALIFGKSIDTCLDDGLGIKSICDQNLVGLQDTSGYDFLNGYSLLPHYKKKEDQITLTNQRVKRLIKEGYKLVCVPEETSLFVNDGKYSVVGEKPIEIIDNATKKIFDIETEISL